MKGPPDGLARAWRALWRPRGFYPLASLTLAIGVAAFASAFTMVESLLGAPPFPHHARIVIYGEEDRDPTSRSASPMLYAAIGLPPGVISRGAAQAAESVNVRSGGRETLARAQRVDGGFLPTLGVESLLPEARSIPVNQSVMVSHAFWRGWLGGDARVVGSTIVINGDLMTVRGVLPPDYRLFADIDFLLPLASTASSRDSAANLTAIARLAPGVSGETIARWIHEKLPETAAPIRPECGCVQPYGTTPLDDALTSKAKPVVLLFFGCSLLVLVAAGVNLSNLMLTRALRRAHEIALTMAFGGAGWRPKLPMIVDIIAVAAGALLLGLLMAWFLVVAIRPFVPVSWIVSAMPIELDWRTCVTAGFASVVVTTLAAMLGAVHSNPDRLLRTQFATGGSPPAGLARRARRLMVLVQIVLAMMLSVLGVSTASRLWREAQIPLGFLATGASSVEINPDATQFPELGDVRRAIDGIRRAALSLPGVDAVGVSTLLPVDSGFFMPFRRPDGTTAYFRYALISPGAVEAMGLNLIAGRTIGAGDLPTSTGVAMVNQAYVENIDSRGVGSWVNPASRLAPNHPLRVVGVVADTPHGGMDAAAVPTVFVPFSQASAGTYAFIRRLVPTFVVIRGAGIATSDPPALQALVQQAVPGLAAGPHQSFVRLAGQVTAQARRNAALAAVFAAMALTLACIGLYAVQMLEVTHGRRDLALRSTLGAAPLDVFGHVLSRGVGMALPGVVLGLLAAIVLEYAIDGSVLITGRIDAGVACAAALLMTCVALLAVALPSLRAAAVRPVSILRGDLPKEAIHP